MTDAICRASPIIADHRLRDLVEDLDAAFKSLEFALLVFRADDSVSISPTEAADILRAIEAAADALHDFRRVSP
jgi:hypothetical protein